MDTKTFTEEEFNEIVTAVKVETAGIILKMAKSAPSQKALIKGIEDALATTKDVPPLDEVLEKHEIGTLHG